MPRSAGYSNVVSASRADSEPPFAHLNLPSNSSPPKTSGGCIHNLDQHGRTNMAKTTRVFASPAKLPWFLLTYAGVVGFGAVLLLLGAATGTLPIFWQVWGALLIVAPIWLARYTFQLSRSARRDLIEFAGALAGLIDEFDPTTRRHSERVSRYAALLARELGLSKR